VVEKSVVEVALVVVELRPVKFCKVDEPSERRFPNVPRLATVREPVKLAAEDIVWPFIKPEVTVPRFELVANKLVEEAVPEKMFEVVALPNVTVPRLAVVEKRFVEEAVVANLLVEVALVVVLFNAVKF
jgi:hypothetical protein